MNNNQITSLVGIDLSKFIVLERENGSRLYITKGRNYPDLSHNWDFNRDWYSHHIGLQRRGGRMLTLPEFWDFLKLLQSGKVEDGKGKKLSPLEIIELYNLITEKRSPLRGEFLDAQIHRVYTEVNIVDIELSLNWSHQLQKGKLVPQFSESLDSDTFLEDKVPGISLNEVIAKHTIQGLPRKDTKEGNMTYWSPANGCVPIFAADHYFFGLQFISPSNSDDLLGARLVCELRSP